MIGDEITRHVVQPFGLSFLPKWLHDVLILYIYIYLYLYFTPEALSCEANSPNLQALTEQLHVSWNRALRC